MGGARHSRQEVQLTPSVLGKLKESALTRDRKGCTKVVDKAKLLIVRTARYSLRRGGKNRKEVEKHMILM